MLRHLPLPGTYSGLTIILSQPSRFDTRNLLSGISGQFFSLDCLEAFGVKRNRCDIRICDDKSPIIEGTRVILLLGERAMKEYIGDVIGDGRTLNEIRGYVVPKDGLLFICSYLPIDCYDIIDHETKHNPHLNKALQADQVWQKKDDEAEDDLGEKSRKGVTQRSNFRFWLETDTRKACRILKDGPRETPEFIYHIYPPLDEAVRELLSHKDEFLYIDFEGDTEWNINTIGFSFGDSKEVWVCPTIRWNYQLAYGRIGALMRALALAIDRNITVAHNGKSYDFFILMWKYRIAIARRVYDTMLAQQRCFPEAEKSLGHCISMWIDMWDYHKDEGIFMPHTPADEQKLWRYNGKDISSMKLIHQGQREHASKIPGLQESIDQQNRAIRPYLLSEMTGMLIKPDKAQELVSNNDRLMNQYLRFMGILMGPEIEPLISSQKAARYFHDALDYPIIARSKKTGAPSLGEKELLKLKLKVRENPVIDLLLAYRMRKKQTGSLKFVPMWSRLGELPREQQSTTILKQTE